MPIYRQDDANERKASAEALADLSAAIAAAEQVVDRRELADELELSAAHLRRLDFNTRPNPANTVPRTYSGNL